MPLNDDNDDSDDDVRRSEASTSGIVSVHGTADGWLDGRTGGNKNEPLTTGSPCKFGTEVHPNTVLNVIVLSD